MTINPNGLAFAIVISGKENVPRRRVWLYAHSQEEAAQQAIDKGYVRADEHVANVYS